MIYHDINRKKSQTFKPKKNIEEGTKQYQLKQYAEATLGSGNLRQAVKLPEGEDINEWLAVNSKKLVCSVSLISFFHYYSC
jgi:MOB kinase activator 1